MEQVINFLLREDYTSLFMEKRAYLVYLTFPVPTIGNDHKQSNSFFLDSASDSNPSSQLEYTLRSPSYRI